MKNLCSKDEPLWNYVSTLIAMTASIRGLGLTKVKLMRRKHSTTRYGQCSQRGVLRITLRGFSNGEWEKNPARAYDIVDTIAHELAHLLHYKHCEKWFSLYVSILSSFNDAGVYNVVSRLRK